LANLKSEILLKDEENKKLLEEKKKLAEENAKKEAFLKEQQKKEKEAAEKNKEVISKLEKEKREKEEAFQKLKKLEEEKKNQEEAEERHKRIEEQLKKKVENDLKKQQQEIDEKIKQGIDKGIQDYKKKNENRININNIDIEDEQLRMNIEELNKQSELYKNQLQDMKKKCYEELNQKYSQILQQKIEEIHNTILKDVQTQNQKILDNYVKKFEESEKRREEDYTNSMSKIMMSNAPKEGDINFSLVKTVHQGIKCNKCGMDPIIGYRYKCPICRDFNLCQNCEENNSQTGEHEHDFIKMRNQEKQPPKKEEKKKPKKEEKLIKKEEINIIKIEENQPPKQPEKNIEYKYELLDKNPERYTQTVYIEDENDIKFEFGIVNTCGVDFPENGKTKFIKENSKEKHPEYIVDNLKAGNKANVIISIPKKNLKFGVKKLNLILNVDGKNCGEPITLTIIIKSRKVEEFRKEFNLDEKEYDENKLLSALQKHKFIKENAFASLFDEN